MPPKKTQKAASIQNRKALFNYQLLEEHVAGIALLGTEVKAIREGKANLQDAFCYFHNNELFIKGMHIGPYSRGNLYNHEATRPRKLLMHKRELRRLHKKKETKGLTIIPKKIFLTPKGLFKVRIALAQGKKLYDKRLSIKERDINKRLARLDK